MSMRRSKQSRPRAAACVLILLAAALAAAPPLPKSAGAPKVGEKAPDFQLPDTTGRTVALSQLRAKGPQGSWVLLVFYRGFW